MTQPQLIEDDDPGMLLEDDESGMLLEDEGPVEPQALSPEPAATVTPGAGLVEILPADFKLPTLLKFVPDVRLKTAADEATRYALAVDVAGPEGLTRADVALTALRLSLAAITEHFAEPADLLNTAHKTITGKRAEWLAEGAAAVKTVGGRMATEQLRLQRIADEERRKRQEEEDRKAREEARQRAAEAKKQQAPAPVVAEMERQAETATAPPVADTKPAPTLTGSSVVKTWKARIAGTPAHAEPLPESAEFSPGQKVKVIELLKAIVDGRVPMNCIQLDDSYLNARAKAEKGTLQIPGIEAFEDVGTRAKPRRAK